MKQKSQMKKEKSRINNQTIKVRKKLSPLARFCRVIVRFFLGKHIVINQNDHEIPDQCILLCTHKGMKGPFVYQSFLPRYCAPWGIHNMLGNYKQRWQYLYHVFYRSKLKIAKLPAFIKATVIALFNKLLYNGCGVIGTYNDARQIKAIRQSVAHLEAGVPVMLFPENSNDGYFEILTQCHGGFVVLAQTFNKRNNADIAIYPSYYSVEKKAIVIGKPFRLSSLLQEGMTREQVSEFARQTINNLGTECQM